MKIYRNEVQVKKNLRILENLRKTFFYWKKIQLQVSKKWEFWFKFLMANRRSSNSLWEIGPFFFGFRKKCSANFLKLGTLLEHLKLFFLNLEHLQKTFFSGKKSNFKFQKSGNFGSNSLWEIGEVQIPYRKSALFFLVGEKNVPQIF